MIRHDYAYRAKEVGLNKSGLWQDIKDAAKIGFIATVMLWALGGFVIWNL